MPGEWAWVTCQVCGESERFGHLGVPFTCKTCKWADNEGRLSRIGQCYVCGLTDEGCNCAPESEES